MQYVKSVKESGKVRIEADFVTFSYDNKIEKCKPNLIEFKFYGYQDQPNPLSLFPKFSKANKLVIYYNESHKKYNFELSSKEEFERFKFFVNHLIGKAEFKVIYREYYAIFFKKAIPH